MTKTTILRCAATAIVLLATSSTVSAQTTATWTGAGGDSLYSNAANWDIGVVPIDNGTTYDVVVPASTSVTFDVGGIGNTIQNLTLGSNSTFRFDLATDLTVAVSAEMDNAKLVSDVGSTAVIPVDSYTANSTGTVFSADGGGTSLDLSSLVTWSQSNIGGSPSRIVTATGGASIDMSGLTTISNSSGDDRVEFRTASSGTIDLSGLTTIDGPSWFDIEAPTLSLPSLGSTSGGGMSITRSAASSTSLPALLSNDGGTWNVPAGGSINAPIMTQLRNSVINIDTGGALNAPNLVDIDGSTINLDAGETFNTSPILAMDNARIILTGGATLTTAATSYSSNFSGTTTVFSADGAGTNLDLSSIQTWTQVNFGGSPRKSAIATGGGNINLSGLTTITNTSSDDEVEFQTLSGGTIDLSSLTTVDGPVRMNIDTPAYSLPSLTTVTDGMTIVRPFGSTMTLPVLESSGGGTWNVPESGSITAPLLTELLSTTVNVGDGGVLNAVNLADVSGSLINLGPNQTFNSSSIQTMDNSRMILSGGATFSVAATSYSSNLAGTTTVFSADGGGTNLDLSSIQTWTQVNFGGSPRKSAIATGGGNINLSGLTTITNTSSDDEVEFQTLSGGTIDLSSLTTVDGPVRMNIDTPAYSLPSLTTVTDGMTIVRPFGSTMTLPVLESSGGGTWNVPESGSITAPLLTELLSTTVNVGDGGVLNAVNLADVSGSLINLGPNQTFNSSSIQTMDNSRMILSGGATFSVAATSYSSNLAGTTTVFSADGGGTNLDLSSIQTWTQVNFGGSPRKSAIATGGGSIDLSGLTTISNASTDDHIEFRTASGGTIGLDSLATIEGPVSFDIEAPTFELTSLGTVTGGMTITRSAGSSTNLPALISSSGGTWNVPTSGSIDAGVMTQLQNTVINIGTDGSLNAPNLVNLDGSTLNLGADQTFSTATIGSLDDARLLLSGGATFAVAATSYSSNLPSTTTVFAADGAGTSLDLSSIDTWTQNNFGGSPRKSTIASGGGAIDLSALATITNASTDDQIFFQAVSGGTIDISALTTVNGPVVFDVESGGQITVGSPATTADAIIIAVQDLGSLLSITGDLLMGPQTTTNVSGGAGLAIAGNFTHQATTESNVELSTASVWMNGDGGQFMEVASEDLGVDGSTSGNFGMGQMQIGDALTATSVNLLEVTDNGNRNGGKEALYLYGLGGPEGLRIAGGSIFVLNDINVYAFEPGAGGQVLLNSLFGPGDFRIPYDDGFLQIAVGDFLWDNASGGAFASEGNWQSSIVPLIADNAAWDLGTTGYTVTFGGNVATNSAVVRTDTVTFDLASNNYRVIGGGVPHALVVAQSTAQQADLTVANGFLSARSAIIAEFAGSTGQLTLSNATAVIKSSLTFGAGDASLTLSSNSRLSADQSVNLGPSAQIDLTGGTISVGSTAVPLPSTLKVFSSGTLRGSGDITGNLDIEGLLEAVVDSAVDHDLISVTGAAELAGAIDVELNFVPDLGSEIVVLDASGGVSGQFASVTGVDFVVVDRASVVDYTATTVKLFTTLPGDANLDGFVDGQDFLLWNANKFSSGAWRTGDFNGDAIVDGQDFLIWNTYKFQSIDAASLVPEPSSGAFLLLCLLALCRVRRAVHG